MPLSHTVSICVKRQYVFARACIASRSCAHARTQPPAHRCLQQHTIESSGIFVDPPSARAGPEQGWQVPGSADAQRQLGLQGLSPPFPAPPDGHWSQFCPSSETLCKGDYYWSRKRSILPLREETLCYIMVALRGSVALWPVAHARVACPYFTAPATFLLPESLSSFSLETHLLVPFHLLRCLGLLRALMRV